MPDGDHHVRVSRQDDPERDPRMPALYDAENPWSVDDDFFLALVGREPGCRVLDLGCGTGRLTVALAAAGHEVVGVDPNGTFLRAARAKPHGHEVLWIEGTSRCLAPGVFDAAVMTSHVAQVFLTDQEWASLLGDLKRTLVPGGVLAFDTRDPRAKAWEEWTKRATHGTLELDDGAIVEGWMDVTSVADGVVTFEWCNVFHDGSRLAGASSLRFRSEEVVRTTLAAAGFRVEHIFGGWRGEAPGPGARELVVVARA